MAGTNEVLSMATDARLKRDLPERIVIPPIRGEMVHLRPATVEDLSRLDELDAFYGASKITGKDAATERAVVHTWVRRSQAWEAGQAPAESGVGDPESRRTIAWAVLTDADHDDDGKVDAASTGNVIGMIFLIDIDGWSRSARIQIVLGRDYRGRGYSRDAMPRVMTYGFAPEPAGLGMHRIWVGVPEKNSRSISVYQSLGFVPSGTSRDALWDAENNKYQDLIVMDTLVDEYDPIRSLDAFGMHLIEDNPGVKEALSAREHSIAIQQNIASPADAQESDAGSRPAPKSAAAAPQQQETGEERRHDSGANRIADEESNWPYGQNERKTSKEAWWRTLGRGRKRDTESE
ncbi:GNAT family N-acetyltransferase [Bifidobacterium callitrichidarum]|nr:GNAT family N-acetyltransferase [Bifidobacterium callitrichidarum]